MAGKMNKKLVLENGAEFFGYGFGDAEGTSRVCEIVFNTSMAGYQEIVSDPTYAGAAVVMTYPLIGNYGITDEDYEAKTPTIGALIAREYNDFPSNFRYTKTLSEYLEENGIEIVPFGQMCEAFVINTCAVTSESERKSRHITIFFIIYLQKTSFIMIYMYNYFIIIFYCKLF